MICTEYIKSTSLTLFFDFLNEFTFIYRKSGSCESLKPRIVDIVRELSKRILVEQEQLVDKEVKSNYVINQCWNVLRSICETSEYIPDLLEPIEEELKPIFEYALEPDKIDFDDDIALLISTCIKLSKRVTDTQKQVFRCFEGIHAKYNGIFGNLLQCINMYIVYNDGWLNENQEAIKSIFDMATKSLFYNKKGSFNVATN